MSNLQPTPEAEIEQIVDELVLQVLEDGGKTVNGITTSKSEASEALANLLNRSRIDERENMKFIDKHGNETFLPYHQYRYVADGLILNWYDRTKQLQTPPATEEATE